MNATHGWPKLLGLPHGSMANPMAVSVELIDTVLDLRLAPQLGVFHCASRGDRRASARRRAGDPCPCDRLRDPDDVYLPSDVPGSIAASNTPLRAGRRSPIVTVEATKTWFRRAPTVHLRAETRPRRPHARRVGDHRVAYVSATGPSSTAATGARPCSKAPFPAALPRQAKATEA